MALVNYESSCSSTESDADDSEDAAEPKAKFAKVELQKTPIQPTTLLPKATALLGAKDAKVTLEEPADDPALHDGRIRSFKHERGNWATHVHIAVSDELLEDLQEMCETALADVLELKPAENLHISLSRTVVLQYHHIDSFIKTLQAELETCGSFNVSLSQLKFYTNEERTRTFIALKIEEIYFEKLQQLLRKVDTVMLDYKLPSFYKEPSFHISFLWCLGDQVAVLNAHLDALKTAIKTTFSENAALTLFINEISCKSGNKEFKFKLK